MGHHILLSLYGSAFYLLDDIDGIRSAFEKAVEACGATVLNRFHHKFDPQGVTIVYALAESHISAHTFPESGSVAIDVYTCGDLKTQMAVDVLVDYFRPIEVSQKEISR